MHADMDAFYASVEMLDNPILRDQALVVGGQSHRAVVAAANYRARTFGIHSAMPMSEARRRCPELTIVPPRFQRYREMSKRIMEVFRETTPIIEPLSLDEAFLDVSDYVLPQDAPALAELLKQQVREVTGGLTVSIGVGPNKLVAKIASDIDKPNGLVVISPEDVLDFIGPLPVSRLWGAGPKTVSKLNQLGFHKIEDLRKVDPQSLSSLGSSGRLFHRFSMGIDDREVSTLRVRKSLGSEMTLSNDTWMDSGCLPWLKSTAIQLAQELTRKRLACRGVRFKLKTTTHQVRTRQMKLDQSTQEWTTIFSAAQQLAAPFFGTTKVRLIGLTVYNLTEPSTQLSLDL